MPPRTRQYVTRPDGTERAQQKPPTAVVLWYPQHELTTILVRRTHDLDLALRLAVDRWDQLRNDGLVDVDLGTDWDRCRRAGWWWTGHLRPSRHLRSDALDPHGRVVRACHPRDVGAGPAVEHRP